MHRTTLRKQASSQHSAQGAHKGRASLPHRHLIASEREHMRKRVLIRTSHIFDTDSCSTNTIDTKMVLRVAITNLDHFVNYPDLTIFKGIIHTFDLYCIHPMDRLEESSAI